MKILLILFLPFILLADDEIDDLTRKTFGKFIYDNQAEVDYREKELKQNLEIRKMTEGLNEAEDYIQ